MASSSAKATQPAGACNGTAADFPNIEQELYDYQMHTKMCKKIAQLTKVIYSLNTKNEEQEAALLALEESHQEELRRAVDEAGRRSRTEEEEKEEEVERGGDEELRRRLEILEGSLEEQRRLNSEIRAEFDAYREEVEVERAVGAPSEEDLDVRRDLEARLEELSRLTEQLQEEKEEATLAQEEAQAEAEQVKEEVRELREEREELSRRVADDLALQQEVQTLQEENQRLDEACQRAVSQLEEAQRQEQEVLRRGLQEALAQWQQREQEQEKAHNALLQERLARLQEDLEGTTKRLGESKRHSLKAQERIQDLEGQLEEARHRVAGAETEAQKADEELAVAKERLLLQENELLCKSEELLSQCSSQTKVSAEAEELRAQVAHLHKQVKELEQQTSGKTSDHARQVKQHVEALSAQRQELQRAHGEELWLARRQAEEERSRLKEQLRKRMEEMMKKHAAELRSAHTSAETERKKAQRDHQVQVEEVKRRSEEERKEVEREKEELQRKLQESVCQVTPGAQLACCASVREELEQALLSLSQTKEDLDHLKEKHQAEISVLKKEKQTLEDRILEKAHKYQEEKKRSECESEFRRRELTEQHLAALTRLRRDKDSEIKEITDSFQRKLKLEEKRFDSGPEKRHKGECHTVIERAGLEKDIKKTMTFNNSLRAQLQSTIQENEQLMQHQDMKEAEEQLWQQHEEALRDEWLEHQQALRALEERSQEELQAERLRQQAQQKLLLDRQKAELTQQHSEWSRQLTQRHMQQIEDLQAELRTHTQLVALQQDFKQQNQAQAFERQLEDSRAEVGSLRRENGELREQLATLQSQLEAKTQELSRLRDAEQQHSSPVASLRCWEEGVKGRQHLEVEGLKREHRKEIQTIVSDFSSAQTRLQARIVSLETELREKEDKLKRRESRTEDLQVIGLLQDKLSERDQVIKRLVEERHHLHQHPLVVSESTTQKTYENRAQPGSLTPTMRKKKMEDTPPRVTSVPNLSSYEKSFLGPEGMAGAAGAGAGVGAAAGAGAGVGSPHAVRSPSFEHGRNTPRTATPTTPVPPPIPESRQGGRYSRGSSSEDFHPSPTFYGQPPRTPEQRSLEPRPEPHDPQRQEWFTKYFSF
ncbi:protein FAM184B isoform X2 [Conger conger]|uniref:protein FAM184B isoform X2 n=1 Tax=Conger conger TaxID=82655 RepID=UPI002A5A3DA5|nr:protein FAM184B isoform X2 [Conger conger]